MNKEKAQLLPPSFLPSFRLPPFSLLLPSFRSFLPSFFLSPSSFLFSSFLLFLPYFLFNFPTSFLPHALLPCLFHSPFLFPSLSALPLNSIRRVIKLLNLGTYVTWWENALKWLVLCSLWPWEPIHFYDNFLFTITMITGTVYPVSHPSLLRICCINFVALRMKSDIPKGGIIDIIISSSPSYFLPAIYYYYYYYSLSIHSVLGTDF